VPEEELLAVDRAKLLALRIVAHRALAYARQEGGVTYARRAYDVFRPIIEEQPDVENGET
jgi:predicted DsbA family dithiol-disulfide isomerase